MLQKYVDDGQVSYGRWQAESSADLDQWLADVGSVDLDRLERDSAIAFLINLYNALVIQQILEKYPIPSIRPTFLGIPNWISFLLFFKKKRYSLSGQSLSLDNIEHDLLRKRYSEYHVHFAVVCASEGCPLLRSNAYFPETVSAQLEEDAQRFINNPDKVRYDAASQTLYCSKLFKWYQDDFLSQAASVPDYIQRYLIGTELPTAPQLVYLPYDWRLNQRTSS